MNYLKKGINSFVSITVCFVISLLVALYTHHEQYIFSIETATDKLTKRVALDLSELQIAIPIINQAADEVALTYYINKINNEVERLNYPIKLLSIQGVGTHSLPIEEQNTVLLPTSHQDVPIVISHNEYFASTSVLAVPFVLTVFFGLFVSRIRPAHNRSIKALQEQISETSDSQLIINLNERSLYLSQFPETKAILPNKPLCFYLAMLQFCRDEPNAKLLHNKNLPEEFIQLANKYFFRLLELGHSRRKRPDFDSNIDKMLSEIRAALDEIFINEPGRKNIFYPLKAQGEGSRSKLHNFALSALNADDYSLIGD